MQVNAKDCGTTEYFVGPRKIRMGDSVGALHRAFATLVAFFLPFDYEHI